MAEVTLSSIDAKLDRAIDLLLELAGNQSTMRAELIEQDSELEALTDEDRRILDGIASLPKSVAFEALGKLIRSR